jgi:hypothetical protein
MEAVIRERIMKIQTRLLRKTALAAAVTLVIGGVASMSSFMGIETGMSSIVSTAYAAQGDSAGGGHKGAMGEGRGGQGGQGAGAGAGGQRGGKSMSDVLADEADDDSDSDRPDWAGVSGGEGRPGGGGNTNPGTTKGDTYGDMILLVRDPITGLPILAADDEGNMWPQACTSEDCTTSVLMVGNEVPEGTVTFEVDLGRSSLVRAPSNVTDSRLEEALSVITSADSISVDEAGRIVVTVDGVAKTIDSPLENLALYIDLMEGLASDSTSPTEAALTPSGLANLETAASLLGAVADKTGDISLDYLMYENLIAGLVAADDYYKFDDFTYFRDYSDSYTIWYSPDGLVAPVPKTMDIDDYLQYVNGTLPDDEEKAALFAAAADDAVEVIELLHTQIVTDDFLNGYVIE